MTAGPRCWTETWRAPALVVAVVLAVFLRSLHGGFVWDDHKAVVENPAVQAPTSWLGLVFDPASVNQFGFVRPLRTLEFAFDRAVFGPGPFAFHVHSLLWHAAASVLLLLVLRRLLRHGGAALVGALFWAVHPVQAETVAWIACRGDLAMAACVFASTLFALRADGFDRDLAASLIAATLAPFYKETALALPLAIAALRWTKLARAPLWPYLAVAAAFAVYRTLMTTNHEPPYLLGGSVAAWIATMARGLGFYVAEVLLPAQSADWHLQPSTSLADAQAAVCIALDAALLASAFVARRRAPLRTLAVAWFHVFLLPVANWPPLYVGVPTAERYLFVPLAGAAVAVGSALTRARRGAWTAAIVAVASLGAASIARCGMWASDDALWDAVAADHPSARAEEFLGHRVRNEGFAQRADAAARFEDALARYHRAIALKSAYERGPRVGDTFAARLEMDAAQACVLLARDAEALFHADEAIRLADVHAAAHTNRAVALERLGFAPQAIDAMRRARSLGFSAPDAGVGSALLRCAAACERAQLPSTARAGFATAVEACPDGPMRREAASRLAGLVARGSSETPRPEEREALARLDARLASLPRGCPAR